jgi:hypothetical protein
MKKYRSMSFWKFPFFLYRDIPGKRKGDMKMKNETTIVKNFRINTKKMKKGYYTSVRYNSPENHDVLISQFNKKLADALEFHLDCMALFDRPMFILKRPLSTTPVSA